VLFRSHAMREYARKLEDANGELAEANLAAQVANKAKDQFLATMSHELRTPLNGVIGMTELLSETPLDERQRGFVEACHASGQTLLAVIDDILDFSKIEAGKLELDERAFHLGRLSRETTATMSFQARQKGLRLVTRLAPEASRGMLGDDVRLRQVLVNLIGNAVKFTDAGEIAVTIEIIDRRDDRCTVRFEVSDSGAGIAADRIDRLFHSFSQADSSTTRRHGGSGLGLAISKRLVELMGGQIGVTSQLGHGSRFWFDVPLRYAPGKAVLESNATEASCSAAATRKVVLAGFRILLAEDNRVNRMLASEILQQDGAECRAVANGTEAVQAVRDEQFHLALMDCQMPHLDGFQAARQIRDLEAGGHLDGHLPIIALTANAIKGDREQCLQAGMDEYISKPFASEALLAMIGRLLGVKEEPAADEPPADAPPAEPTLTTAQPAATTPDAPIDHRGLMARCLGNLEFAQSLLSVFAEDLPERMELIARQLREKDVAAVVESAHTLKGSAGMMSAESLRAVAAQIEALGKAGDLAEAVSLAERLGQEANRCLRFVPEIREIINAG
jgi:CheY-like chemotaxis protein/HPt (histidine-containing phosphotransfer) domain-containing protein